MDFGTTTLRLVYAQANSFPEIFDTIVPAGNTCSMTLNHSCAGKVGITKMYKQVATIENKLMGFLEERLWCL